MNTLPHIEVILPVYNEAENIRPLVEQLDSVARRMSQNARISYLFVNDGSTDESISILNDLFDTRSDIRVVNLVHNFGHGSALAAGLKHFKADIAVVMDADSQDNPKAITKMFEEWQKGQTTVVAERGNRRESTRFLFKLFYFLLHKASKDFPKVAYGTYCMIDKKVVQRMLSYEERVRYFPGLVALASNGIKSIKIDRAARAHGESRVGLFGLIHLAVTALLSFSSAPIRLVSLLGIICSLLGFIAGIAFIGIKVLTDQAIPGWASLMTAIAIASGIQLLCTGIIGEYIARIYDEVKKRPLYLVDDVLENDPLKRSSSLKSIEEQKATLAV